MTTDAPASNLYRAAPIIEAVAELRFATAIDHKAMKRLSKKLAPFYPNEAQQVSRGVDVNFQMSVANFVDEEVILRRSSEDEVDVAVIRDRRLSFSRLAPYTRWEDFQTRIRRDLELLCGKPKTPFAISRS